MQIKSISVALWMAYAGSASVAIGADAPAPAQPPLPQTSEAWVQNMTDFSRNGIAFKDPRAFLAWSNAVTEPGFYPVLVQGMTNPTMPLNMLNSSVSPAAMRNVASFADPAIAARWMGAAIDPRFYTQMATQFVDPAKMMRWVMMPMDPRVAQVAGQMMNPAQAMQWAMVPTDPRLMNAAGNMINPALYTGMAGVAMNPQSYPMWGAVAQPLRMPVAMAAPASALPKAVASAVAAVPVALVAAVSSADAPKVLSTDMLFQPGKADVKALTADGKKALDAVVAQIKAMADVGQVVVMGHADPTGKAKSNKALSQKRAKAVKAYLTTQGVKPGVIMTSGLGDTQPVVKCDPKAASADKMSCNAPNRRIEVEIRKLPPK